MTRKYAIAVSGTPGTGKSTFARELAETLDAELIDLNALIEVSGAYELDGDGTRAVDPEDLRGEFSKAIKKIPGSFVAEGLLAHLLPKEVLTHVVILRTRPEVLEKRLRERGYPEKKLEDNLGAEALDVILWEAAQAHGEERVYEIDTSDLDAPGAAKVFLDALEGKVSLRPGKIDWLSEFYNPQQRKKGERSKSTEVE